MGKAACYVLWGTICIQAGVTSFSALWPLLGGYVDQKDFKDWWDVYSISGSNLDIWGLSLCQSVLIPALIGVLLLRSAIPPFFVVNVLVSTVIYISQVGAAPAVPSGACL
jgi:hypothetical protein